MKRQNLIKICKLSAADEHQGTITGEIFIHLEISAIIRCRWFDDMMSVL